MKHNFMATQIPSLYSQSILSKHNYSVGANYTDKIYSAIFKGMTEALRAIKSKEVPTSFVFYNVNGDFIMGAVVQYLAPEDEGMQGNWSYEITLDSEKVKGTNEVTLNNLSTHIYFEQVANRDYGFHFKQPDYLVSMALTAINLLLSWLDEAAVEDDTIELELPGIFLASVEVKKGAKVITITPDGDLKQLIKKDSDIQVQ